MFNNLMTGTNKVLGETYLKLEALSDSNYPSDRFVRTKCPIDTSKYRILYGAYRIKCKGVSMVKFPVKVTTSVNNSPTVPGSIRIVLLNEHDPSKNFQVTKIIDRNVGNTEVEVNLANTYDKKYLSSNEVSFKVIYEVISDIYTLYEYLVEYAEETSDDWGITYEYNTFGFGYLDKPKGYKLYNTSSLLTTEGNINISKPIYTFERGSLDMYISEKSYSGGPESDLSYVYAGVSCNPNLTKSAYSMEDVVIELHVEEVSGNDTGYSGSTETFSIKEGDKKVEKYVGDNYGYGIYNIDRFILKKGQLIRLLPDETSGDHTIYDLTTGI